jgi:hypothetical protein
MSERKYGQRGYQEREKQEKKERPKEKGPRPEQLGPRTPRMVGSVLRARCSNCGAVLMSGFDENGQCPKCALELHCCKQCRHFDTGVRFECTQPIPERIAKKDGKNSCTFFEFRFTVEKDTSPTLATPSPRAPLTSPSSSTDARRAFDDLFKK